MSSDTEMLELELIMVLTDDILILIMARTFTKSMIMIQIFGQHDAEMLSLAIWNLMMINLLQMMV